MMKTILLMLVCATAHAAPLPPWPGGTKVKRPALLSPRDASALRAAPMRKLRQVSEQVPGLAPTRPVKHTLDMAMEDGSVKDVTLLEALQRANVGVRFEYTDGCPDSRAEWITMAFWSQYPIASPVFVELAQDKGQRVGSRSFRVVEVTGGGGGAAAGVGVKPTLKGLRTWRGKK